jgi:hypothetical protein
MRFTLRNLFLVVVMAALASAGMVSRTQLWAEAILAATILLFVVVAIRANALRGRQRAFAAAFSAVGLGYLFLLSSNLSESLITNYPLAWAAKTFRVPAGLNRPTPTPAVVPQPGTASQLGEIDGVDFEVTAIEVSSMYTFTIEGYRTFFSRHESKTPIGSFMLIGQCVWSWLFALVAGWFAARVLSRSQPSRT